MAFSAAVVDIQDAFFLVVLAGLALVMASVAGVGRRIIFMTG